MMVRGLLVGLAVILAGAGATPAAAAPADVLCVDVQRPECTDQAGTLGAALAASPGVIYLGPGPFTGTFASAQSVEIAGTGATVVAAADDAQPALALTGADVRVHGVRVQGRLKASGTVTLDDDDLAALDLATADAGARGLTVTGPVKLSGGSLGLSSSVVTAADPFVLTGGATVTTDHSAYAQDADAPAPDRIDVPPDPRPVPGSALVDAGDPAPLAPFEPFEDAAGDTRVTDGDGAGAVRRDIGAYELQPPAAPAPAGNVLANGGGEAQLAGWSGSFSTALYGDPSLPGARAGAALAAGQAFFTAGSVGSADLFQRIDVTAAAGSIDRKLGTASFSGLLGGYGADADTLTVRALFKDPENVTIGSLDLPPVTAADRGNDTNLLPRAAAGPIPARTRAIDVVLSGDRQAGTYTDAYADNLALVLSVPGVPVDPPGRPSDPPVDNLKPFSGVPVLTGRPTFSRKGGGRVLLACATATVAGCSGSLELRGRLPKAKAVTRIARYSVFKLRPGKSRHVVVRLLAATRTRLRHRRALRATLIVIARDGQGLQRRATVPVRLKLPAPRSHRR